MSYSNQYSSSLTYGKDLPSSSNYKFDDPYKLPSSNTNYGNYGGGAGISTDYSSKYGVGLGGGNYHGQSSSLGYDPLSKYNQTSSISTTNIDKYSYTPSLGNQQQSSSYQYSNLSALDKYPASSGIGAGTSSYNISSNKYDAGKYDVGKYDIGNSYGNPSSTQKYDYNQSSSYQKPGVLSGERLPTQPSLQDKSYQPSNSTQKEIRINKHDPNPQDLFNKYGHLSDEQVYQIGTQGQMIYKDIIDKTSVVSKYDQILDNAIREGKFVDNEFPPNEMSLHHNDPDFKFNARGITFLKAQQIFKQGYDIFQGKIEPNDIVQGELGDCYLLATLASIAEWDNRIKKIFHKRSLTQEALRVGCFCVNICFRGVWTEVIVDDYFPCRNGQPCFTTTNEKELWVLILEKAWAKLHNCYYYIEAGLTKEALHDFTGAPAFTIMIPPKDPNYLWEQILDGEKNNFIMTAGTKGDDDSKNHNGILEGHAYSMLAGVLLSYRGQQFKLVKMRNPHGTTEWTKNWGDSDPRWNEISQSDKQRIGYSNADDGIFFMDYEEFLHYFDGAQFCYYFDNYVLESLLTPIKMGQTAVLEVTLDQTGVYFFAINHLTNKVLPESQQFDYASVQVKVLQSDKRTVIQQAKNNTRDIFVGLTYGKALEKKTFQAGTYYVEITPQWADRNTHRLALSIYGPTKAKIKLA